MDARTETLRGPWPDEADDEGRLAHLRAEYPRWRIWRGRRQDGHLGQWCAKCIDGGSREDLAAETAAELEALLQRPSS